MFGSSHPKVQRFLEGTAGALRCDAYKYSYARRVELKVDENEQPFRVKSEDAYMVLRDGSDVKMMHIAENPTQGGKKGRKQRAKQLLYFTSAV